MRAIRNLVDAGRPDGDPGRAARQLALELTRRALVLDRGSHRASRRQRRAGSEITDALQRTRDCLSEECRSALSLAIVKTYTTRFDEFRRAAGVGWRVDAAADRDRRRRAGGARRGNRPCAARRHRRWSLDEDTHGQRRLARDLLRQAHARNPRPAGLRRARSRHAACGWNVGKVFFRDALALSVRPLAGARAPAAGVRQSAAILLRGVPRRSGAHGSASMLRWHNASRRRRAAVDGARRCRDRRRPTAITRSTPTG